MPERATPDMASMVSDLLFLLENGYDFIFLQEVGNQEVGAHESVKVPAINQPARTADELKPASQP